MRKKNFLLVACAALLVVCLTGCLAFPLGRRAQDGAQSEAASSSSGIDINSMLQAMESARVGDLTYLMQVTVALENGILAKIYVPENYSVDSDGVMLGSAEDVQISARQGEMGDDYKQAFENHYEDVKQRVQDDGLTVEYESHYFSHPDGIAHLRAFAGKTEDGKMYSSTQCAFLYSDLASGAYTVLWYAVWTDEGDAEGNGGEILREVERSMDIQIPEEVWDWVYEGE